jgi:hypothetical protein
LVKQLVNASGEFSRKRANSVMGTNIERLLMRVAPFYLSATSKTLLRIFE